MSDIENSPAVKGNPNWKKGVSGNPGGRPKAVKELLERARKMTPAALDLWESLLEDENADMKVRLEASKLVAAYGLGRPGLVESEEEESKQVARISPSLAARLAALEETH
jgi:hypothetical protein